MARFIKIFSSGHYWFGFRVILVSGKSGFGLPGFRLSRVRVDLGIGSKWFGSGRFPVKAHRQIIRDSGASVLGGSGWIFGFGSGLANSR